MPRYRLICPRCECEIETHDYDEELRQEVIMEIIGEVERQIKHDTSVLTQLDFMGSPFWQNLKRKSGECPECRGTGRQYIRIYSHPPASLTRETICSTCKGAGIRHNKTARKRDENLPYS